MIRPNPLDGIILRALQEDATQSARALVGARNLNSAAVQRRIRQLEEAGAIRARRVVLDRAALGFGVTVFLGRFRNGVATTRAAAV